MLFSSTEFLLLFFPIVMILYYNPIVKNRTYRNVLLLLASLFFYAWGEPVFVILLIASISVNWFVGIRMDKSRYKKALLIFAIGWNILIIFTFKYLTFVLYNIGLLFNTDFSDIQISLPLGISFFTFQIISYVIDLYRGETKVQRKWYKFALYVSMFPQLVAGPIVRYQQISDEIDYRAENAEDFSLGMIRFVYGLGKKVVFSNYMGTIADNMFYLSKNGDISVGAAWLGAIAYTLQIYYDFSGYSDMAIGLGRMFGFHFEENFQYPYMAKSITDFWRRWHISLSTWFRDYIYIPLGGSRKGIKRRFVNTFVVWLLTGIWHGANWTFIVWGLGYFVLLTLERRLDWTKGVRVFGRIYTLFFVNLLWVIFRADNLQLAWRYIAQMFGEADILWDTFADACLNGSWCALLGAMIFCFPVWKTVADHLKMSDTARKNFAAVGAIPILILCIAKCLAGSYNPFIYFNF